jgi:hypothetical protein
MFGLFLTYWDYESNAEDILISDDNDNFMVFETEDEAIRARSMLPKQYNDENRQFSGSEVSIKQIVVNNNPMFK